MVAITKALTRRRWLAAITTLFALTSTTFAGPLDEMAVERWAKLKEAERYQLNVAEKFYRENQFKVAADEYEKFLKLYDRSEGAAFAQLKWSHCQVALRKQNTAIKDGYQSVLDYYPDTPEAPVAALLIGRTHRDTGDLKQAKKGYAKAVAAYPKHFAAVMARLDLVDIAVKEMDPATQTALLTELTYNVERKGPTAEPCQTASGKLARLQFQSGNFEEGVKALSTTFKDDTLVTYLMNDGWGRLLSTVHELTADPKDEPRQKAGEKLADAASAWLKTRAAAGLADEKTKAKAVETWFAVADVRRYARQPDKQKAALDEMVAVLGASDALLGRIAQWCKENKKPEEARQTYAKFKDAAEGRALIAQSYYEEKQYDKAIAVYQQLAAGDAKTAPKWLAAEAYAQRQAGKPDQAIIVYTQLLAKDAANAAEYHFQIAETLYYAQRWKECITAYRGTERFPQNYQHMAAANRNLKQYDEAIALYTQIAATPQYASWALYQIASTHEQAGRKEDAIKVFKQVCDKFPKSSEGSQAHTHLNEKYKISVTLGGAKD